MRHIQDKTYLCSKKTYRLRGGEYEEKVYEVPKIEMGDLIFKRVPLDEESTAALTEITIRETGSPVSLQNFGKIGWKLFWNVNVLLDLGNDTIVVCSSPDVLQHPGYQLDTFEKIPLLLNRNLLEIDAKTPEGLLRCVLDTGCSWNLLNRDLEEGKTLEQYVFDESRVSHFSSFTIGEKECGPTSFRCVPIQLPIRVEAILGMEFFNEHIVFINFSDHCIYFKKRDLKSCL